jgi:hypothetical protein
MQYVTNSPPSDKLSNSQNVAKKYKNNWCRLCHVNGVGNKRSAYGHTICKPCAEEKAREDRLGWCVAIPYSKGAYQLITNADDLRNTNPKNTKGIK